MEEEGDEEREDITLELFAIEDLSDDEGSDTIVGLDEARGFLDAFSDASVRDQDRMVIFMVREYGSVALYLMDTYDLTPAEASALFVLYFYED